MKLLKTIIAATVLFGLMVSGAYADRGDREWNDGHRYSQRRGHDHHGWSEHRRDRHRYAYRRHHWNDRHHGYVRPWMPPRPFAFWRWDGHHRHHRHDRW